MLLIRRLNISFRKINKMKDIARSFSVSHRLQKVKLTVKLKLLKLGFDLSLSSNAQGQDMSGPILLGTWRRMASEEAYARCIRE